MSTTAAAGRVAVGHRPPFLARRAAGFTLIELLVVISVILLLAALTMPVIRSSISSAQRAQCVSNLRQLGEGLVIYANWHKNHFPYCDRARSGWPRHWYTHNAYDEDTDDFDSLGRLFDARTIQDSDVFYCPSYEGAWLCNPGPERWREARQSRLGGDINCPYIYRGKPDAPYSFKLGNAGAHAIARERSYYHGSPWLNVLYGDGTVERFSNQDGSARMDYDDDTYYEDWEAIDDRRG